MSEKGSTVLGRHTPAVIGCLLPAASWRGGARSGAFKTKTLAEVTRDTWYIRSIEQLPLQLPKLYRDRAAASSLESSNDTSLYHPLHMKHVFLLLDSFAT